MQSRVSRSETFTYSYIAWYTTILQLFTHCIHAECYGIPRVYSVHTVFIQWSYNDHTVFIQCSYNDHTTHTVAKKLSTHEIHRYYHCKTVDWHPHTPRHSMKYIFLAITLQLLTPSAKRLNTHIFRDHTSSVSYAILQLSFYTLPCVFWYNLLCSSIVYSWSYILAAI